MIGSDHYITFKEDTHQYFNTEGIEYSSVSRVLRKFTPQFDRNGISRAIARTQASIMGQSIDECQKQILSEWDQARDSSIDRGNWIHENIEAYLTIGSCDKEVIGASKQIASFIRPFYRYYCEAVLYLQQFQTAGMSDLVVQRQKDVHGVWDFYDYKTNESRGIYYDSIKRNENGSIKKHYNQFLLPPVGHLEHCNYNLYALQLSIYAYMAARTYQLKVGRLGIIFIDKEFKAKMLPVPYMRYEAELILSENNASIPNR